MDVRTNATEATVEATDVMLVSQAGELEEIKLTARTDPYDTEISVAGWEIRLSHDEGEAVRALRAIAQFLSDAADRVEREGYC